jgi:hypothetical protein
MLVYPGKARQILPPNRPHNSAFTMDFVPETKPFRLTESVKAAG